MPPVLALCLTLVLIFILLWREAKLPYKPSLAVWIPSVWLFIQESRSVTEWFYLGTPISGGDITEGTPIDRAVLFLLILAGLLVLLNRKISWAQLFRSNRWLTFFFLYCGVSLLWSDFPFVGFKRWTKAFGDPIMVLILLTDREPIRAVERVIKICAYFVLPLSIVFIKYYPQIGRGFSEWTGAASSIGVTTNKNILGFDLLICGLFLTWIMYSRWRGNGRSGKWTDDVGIPASMLGMVAWLFMGTDSKTSLICLVLALLVFFGLGVRPIRKHIGSYILVGLVGFSALDLTFNVTQAIIEGSGRDTTLTGRTELWSIVLHMQESPLIGYGFESFWLGDRLKRLQSIWGSFKPTQAHNGYIEMYLNLGWVGVLMMAGVIVSCYFRTRTMLSASSEMTEVVLFGRVGMAFLAAYIFYNYTEGAFKSLHPMFVLLLLFTIKPPQAKSRTHQSGLGVVGRKGGLAQSVQENLGVSRT